MNAIVFTMPIFIRLEQNFLCIHTFAGRVAPALEILKSAYNSRGSCLWWIFQRVKRKFRSSFRSVSSPKPLSVWFREKQRIIKGRMLNQLDFLFYGNKKVDFYFLGRLEISIIHSRIQRAFKRHFSLNRN